MSVGLVWKLEEGYSRFIRGSHLSLRMKAGPARPTLNLSPALLADRSKPLEMIFEATRTFRGSSPGGVSWRVNPSARIRALILFEGNAFLGNFRVPPRKFAVQWEVEGASAASAQAAPRWSLLEVRGNSRLRHSWVTPFPEGTSIRSALGRAWAGFRDPLDPRQAARLEEGQVIRWRWQGKTRLNLGFGFGTSWQGPWESGHGLGRAAALLEAGAGLDALLELSESGEFSLQLRRRGGRLELRLRRHRDALWQTGVGAGLHAGTRVRSSRLGPESRGLLKTVSKGLTGPLERQLNRAVREALARRVELGLAVERTRWRRDSTVLRADWSLFRVPQRLSGYERLLEGRLPVREPGIRLDGTLERVSGRRFTIGFSLFPGLSWSGSRERSIHTRIHLTPSGDVVIEISRAVEKSRYGWGEVQFLRLLRKEVRGPAGRRRWTDWSRAWEGEYGRPELSGLLELALRTGLLKEFNLPRAGDFPVRVRLMAVTRFSPDGVEAVRRAGHGLQWEALIRALELSEPDRYGRPTYWRDWIDFAEVRREIDRNPVQAHLASRYPGPGRSPFQRVQVVAAYRRVKRLVGLLEKWRAGDPEGLEDTVRLGLDLPLFVWFHLVCPGRFRRSSVVMTGDLEDFWGDEALWEGLLRSQSL